MRTGPAARLEGSLPAREQPPTAGPQPAAAVAPEHAAGAAVCRGHGASAAVHGDRPELGAGLSAPVQSVLQQGPLPGQLAAYQGLARPESRPLMFSMPHGHLAAASAEVLVSSLLCCPAGCLMAPAQGSWACSELLQTKACYQPAACAHHHHKLTHSWLVKKH